jgi:hypothetical protein
VRAASINNEPNIFLDEINNKLEDINEKNILDEYDKNPEEKKIMESNSKFKKIKKYNKNIEKNSNLININDFINEVFTKTLNEESFNNILKTLSNNNNE